MTTYRNDARAIAALVDALKKAVSYIPEDGDAERDLREEIEDAIAGVEIDFQIGHVRTEDDPTPWCNGCGAKVRSACDCGPLARND